MCISFKVSIDPIKVISATWTAIKRPLGYLKHPEAAISRLQNAMDNLHSKRGDLIERLCSVELAGETPTHEVRYWLGKFDVVKVSKIRNDHPNGRSFRCCVNRRAEACLAEITASAAVEFDTVATRLPPSGVQEVAAEWPVNVSMGSYLSRLQAHIQDDSSRIIGIWGMGGVGKTTLLQGLNNQLLHSSESAQTPPAFDYVISTVATKDCNLVQLQRDIEKGVVFCIVARRLRLCLGGGTYFHRSSGYKVWFMRS
ncbi:putative disease resistance protein [Platanthera zijinensis]|uniref:Disease resistance protein n=1 Tax=Platanthera zijinensis TaxID=2320716 RepID=A0AAP0B782_9ASPA